jgi:hypothetical protein
MLDKFLFGNKQIPEMYFGNIPVAKIYFGNTLIWEKEGYVPYDSTCSIIITGDDTTQKFSVQVMKNGEDVTSSLDHFNGWAYIVNDVLPVYRLFVHNIPYGTVIANGKEFSITELINACKVVEGITDSRYDDTKGEYHIDASAITSKAGGSFPSSGAISGQNNIVVPYTLTEDTSTNDVWMVVSQNTSNTPIEIKTLQVATTYVDGGETSIHVIHESGVLIYKYDTWVGSPSVITKTIGDITYNYIALDLANLSSEGAFKLRRNEKYFIRVKHANNNNNHYYYRNGGILGIVGYVKGSIGNIPHQATDISQLTYKGIYSTKVDMLDNVKSVNAYGKYTGTSDLFSNNTLYKCKTAFTHRGLTNLDYQLLMMNDGELGSYNGESGSMGLGNNTYIKSGAAVNVVVTDDYTIIAAEQDSTKIFKYTGNSVGDIFEQNKFYSCNTPTTITAIINSEPDTATVNVDDVYLLTTPIYNPQHSSGWNNDYGFYKVTAVNKYSYTTLQDANYVNGNGNYYFQNGANIEIAQYQTRWVAAGYYKVTNYDPAAQYKTFTLEELTAPSFTVAKQNSPVTDETNNMKAKLTELNGNNLSTYYDTISCMDLSNVTISTDHKYEVLMGA